MNADSVVDISIVDKFYPADDWHTMYIYEIEKVLIQE